MIGVIKGKFEHRGTLIGRISWEDDEADAFTSGGKLRTACKLLEARRGAGKRVFLTALKRKQPC